MSSLLVNKSVIITGASRGIGLAIAARFAQEGASKLLLVSRSNKGLLAAKKIVAEQQNTSPCAIDTLDGDVGDCRFWKAFSSQARAEKLHYDILVNAAGVKQESLLISTHEENIEDIIRTNLNGTILATQAFAKLMVRARRSLENPACVINIASLLATRQGRGASVYAASKAGVIAFTRAAALELGRVNIRVNTIVPGFIDTSMTKDISENSRHEITNQIPLGRFGTPAEVADAAVFLATNKYTDNCILNIDGGLSAA